MDQIADLVHLVLFHDTFAGGGRAWRAIAAFDCEEAARTYMVECVAYKPFAIRKDYKLCHRRLFHG
jgi:hypothetical protein